MSDTDLHSLSVDQLNEAFRAKQLSPVEVTEAALARIDSYNDAVNAFVVVDREAAMASAKSAEARWRSNEPLSPIDGVPTTLKDTMLAKGWPTLRGSCLLYTSPSPRDGLLSRMPSSA